MKMSIFGPFWALFPILGPFSQFGPNEFFSKITGSLKNDGYIPLRWVGFSCPILMKVDLFFMKVGLMFMEVGLFELHAYF